MSTKNYQPLAESLRPQNLAEFVGQSHLLAPGRALRESVEAGRLHSMILWGPPGTGKTTLARLMAGSCGARFKLLSAVTSGVKDVRTVVSEAKDHDGETVLFLDEVHRFNKAQQDAFLPHVEDGTLILVGATTENPAFELNNALLSRLRVYVLKPLVDIELQRVLDRALTDKEKGVGRMRVELNDGMASALVRAADGDARRLLNFLEVAVQLGVDDNGNVRITEGMLPDITGATTRRFDRGGDYFYDQISALHKSIRGTDPDASLYWLARMLEAGCDPRYIARRLIRVASEDIGNADPRALTLALNSAEAYERLGTPEGELALAQATVYLACAPKSNAVYKGFNAASADATDFGTLDVPVHLRNAPTKLAQQLEHGKGYRYAHDEPNQYSQEQTYLPEELQGRTYYEPVDSGLEIRIREKLARLKGKLGPGST
ncbi:MAG TPA: replication-associated recombination protein A [Gammaproteobacteria bacterium]|nr:replication-associated recombination protein A [Gammaproteobacteria bacterium]HIM05552.1 replication-associated recombination protein A [Gammaproteobacteria bacterium]